MLVVAAILACQVFCRVPFVSGDTSRLYITAEEVLWDYAPSGNLCSEDPTAVKGSELYISKGIGSTYIKAKYVQYTNESFRVRQNRTSDEEHLGLLGPRLFQLPGDVLEVVFLNRLPFPANIVPSGAFTNSTSAAQPGQTLVYNWTIGNEAAPAADALGSSRLWLYRSTVDMEGHANAGLLGPLIVTRPESALPSKQPSDVDQTLIVSFQVVDENASPLLNATMAKRGLSGTAGLSPDDFVASNKKHTVGSRIFCNTQGLNIQLGSRVRWHVVAEGSEVDMHNTHWHGNTLVWEGRNADQLSLLAGSVRSGDMVVDNPGRWFFHCHVNDHITNGMKAIYDVPLPPGRLGIPPGLNMSVGAVRQYYIAAERVLWDFAPLGGNACSGKVQPLNAYGAAHVLHNASAGHIGSKRWRAHYVEYTDATFTQRKERAPEEAYLGDLGPILRAIAGHDTIVFHFLNRLDFPVSVHPHGVFYNKSSEGALYSDGTTGADKADDSVMPNTTYTYVWEVRERSGPGPLDPSSVVWMYHSHHAEVQDTISGLYGAMIVSRKELARPDGSPTDVDREFVTMFWVAHERMTFYAEDNIRDFLPNAVSPANASAAASKVVVPTNLTNEADPSSEADHFYGVNGMVNCNLPKMHAQQGERVRFHIFTLGTQDDLHAPSLVASAWLDDGLRKESLPFMPGAMRSADAVLNAPGEFVLGCRTTLHVDNGMAALLSVAPNASSASDGGHGLGKVHYIRAELVQWDAAPGGLIDQCTGQQLTDDTAIYADPHGPGLAGNLSKALYRGYTDASFSTPLPHVPQHGILGPILHVQTGQYITVVFQNALPFPANIAPGGGLLQVQPTGRGAGHMVAPNQTVTYVWQVPAHAGPGPGDFSTVAYIYRSTVDITGHENAGLLGAIVIERPDSDADAYVEVPLLFSIQDESLSALYQANLDAKAAQGVVLNTTTTDYIEANKKHSVNGYIMCNMPEIKMQQGARMRLILIGVGSETGMHTPGFTDLIQHTPGGPTYVVELYPGMAKVVGMYADAPGRWEFRCNVQHHFTAGMKGVLAITSPNSQLDTLALPSY